MTSHEHRGHRSPESFDGATRGRGRAWAALAVCGSALAVLGSACDGSATSGTGGGGAAGGPGGMGGSGGTGGAAGGESAPLVLETDKGAVEGVLAGSTRAFLGVPFASPPVGDLRWKPPVPAQPWTETLKVGKKGRACTQLNALSGSLDASSGEDCLYLNVWTPEKPASASQPVLVWIHGGAFVFGSGSEAAYDGRVLSEATGAVVVTINYRLGPLGFLAHPELSGEDTAHPVSGNYGILDQRLALEWVKKNIAAFAGDPANVTIFGESAGGISTCMQMLSPGSEGLFHRAVIQSGPCNLVDTEAQAFTQGAAFVQNLGCEGTPDVLACLREKPVEEVMTALPSSGGLLNGTVSWIPVVDGLEIPAAPASLLAAGDFAKVPVILGSNADEATLFFALESTTVADEAAFATLAEELVPGKGPDIVAAYPVAEYGSAHAAALAAVGDAGFVCPTRRAARAMAAAGVPTFVYHFTYPPPGALFPDLGAFHSAEIKFLFGNPGQLLPKPPEGDEVPLHEAMAGYWSRHAAKGDPNGDGAFEWPSYAETSDENIVLDLTLSKQAGLRKEQCDFWDGVVIPL